MTTAPPWCQTSDGARPGSCERCAITRVSEIWVVNIGQQSVGHCKWPSKYVIVSRSVWDPLSGSVNLYFPDPRRCQPLLFSLFSFSAAPVHKSWLAEWNISCQSNKYFCPRINISNYSDRSTLAQLLLHSTHTSDQMHHHQSINLPRESLTISAIFPSNDQSVKTAIIVCISLGPEKPSNFLLQLIARVHSYIYLLGAIFSVFYLLIIILTSDYQSLFGPSQLLYLLTEW